VFREKIIGVIAAIWKGKPPFDAQQGSSQVNQYRGQRCANYCKAAWIVSQTEQRVIPKR
jgi:hypothetical protein